MQLKDFTYDLPAELIAQEPASERDLSRMMVVCRSTGQIQIRAFRDLPEFLGPGDLVVVNDSRVFPARLIGRKETGGLIEILLLARRAGTASGEAWEVLLRPAKRVITGTKILFGEGCEALVAERLSEKQWVLNFHTAVDFETFLGRCGRAPLPPYIKRRRDRNRSDRDLERYQTVYARESGSVAAPTAGLHFTREVIDRIGQRGAGIAAVTLHVGYGTFLPITADRVEDHVMEKERYWISAETARRISEAQRVIAVGTTATRVLESAVDACGRIQPQAAETGLFIYPGFSFRRVDALLTNFHLPRSSLFLLVCAFAGRELVGEAYRIAIENRFRFYSYGDCMLVI